MDGFDAALARYRAFLAHDPITPLLRRSLALLVPGNIRVDTVTADDRLRCTTDGTAVTVGGAEYLPVSYTHLRAHETRHDLVCRLLLEKKKNNKKKKQNTHPHT